MSWLTKIPWGVVLEIIHKLIHAFNPMHCCECLGCNNKDHHHEEKEE